MAGLSFQKFSAEHKLAKDGSDANNQRRLHEIDHIIDVYFKEPGELVLGSLDVIEASPISTMFKPGNFEFGASGAGNNTAQRHCTDGVELIDQVVDAYAIRKTGKSCECPQRFEITHSLDGGTASGLVTVLFMKMRDNYLNKLLQYLVYVHRYHQTYQM